MTLFSKFRRSKRSSEKEATFGNSARPKAAQVAKVKPVYRHIPTHAAQDALTATPFIYTREECSRRIEETRQRTKEANRANGIGTPQFASRVVLRQKPGEPLPEFVAPKEAYKSRPQAAPRNHERMTPKKGQPYFSHADSPSWVRNGGRLRTASSLDSRGARSPSVYSAKFPSSPSVQSEYSRGTNSPGSFRAIPAHHPGKHYAVDSPDCGEYRGPPMRPLFVPPSQPQQSPTPTASRRGHARGPSRETAQSRNTDSGVSEVMGRDPGSGLHWRGGSRDSHIREQSKGPYHREQSKGPPQERRQEQSRDHGQTLAPNYSWDSTNEPTQRPRDQSRGPHRDQSQGPSRDQSRGPPRERDQNRDTRDQSRGSLREREQNRDVSDQSHGPRGGRDQSRGPARDGSRGPPRNRSQSRPRSPTSKHLRGTAWESPAPPLPLNSNALRMAEANKKSFVPAPLFAAQGRQAAAHAAVSNYSRPVQRPATNFSRPAQQGKQTQPQRPPQPLQPLQPSQPPQPPIPPLPPARSLRHFNPASYLGRPIDRPVGQFVNAKGLNFGAVGRPSNPMPAAISRIEQSFRTGPMRMGLPPPGTNVF